MSLSHHLFNYMAAAVHINIDQRTSYVSKLWADCIFNCYAQGNMKQHMMTHKNRDGTPISVELLNSVNVDRSRSRSSNSSATSLIVKDSSNKSNSSDDFNPHSHHLPPPPPPPTTVAGQQNDSNRRATANNLAAMMMLNPTPAALKEHCLSLTIQHSHDRNGGHHHDGLPLKEQNSPTSELLLAQQQQMLLQRGGPHRGNSSTSRAASSAKKRGKSFIFFEFNILGNKPNRRGLTISCCH